MGQLRKKAKALSVRIREGDSDAASELLKHSVSLGHGKLALRRYFLARAMGAVIAEDAKRYCDSLSVGLPNEVSGAMAREERRKALHYMKRKKEDG